MNLKDELRRLAERQHALISVEQARELGAGRGEIRWLRLDPDWELLTVRVLRLRGAPRSVDEPFMAFALDAGGGTVLSHFTAGVFWAVPSVHQRRLEGSRPRGRTARPALGYLHDCRYLPEHHTTTVRGVPITTLARTLYDLAARLSTTRIIELLDRIGAKSPGTLTALHNMLPEIAASGRNGITVMREVLDERPPGYKFPESGLERRFEAILKSADEPPLERQVDLGGHQWIGRVDYLDRELGLIVEVDSILHHTTPGDVARDAERDAQLLAAGFRKVVRVSEEEIFYRPWEAVRKVREARKELRRTSAA